MVLAAPAWHYTPALLPFGCRHSLKVSSDHCSSSTGLFFNKPVLATWGTSCFQQQESLSTSLSRSRMRVLKNGIRRDAESGIILRKLTKIIRTMCKRSRISALHICALPTTKKFNSERAKPVCSSQYYTITTKINSFSFAILRFQTRWTMNDSSFRD